MTDTAYKPSTYDVYFSSLRVLAERDGSIGVRPIGFLLLVFIIVGAQFGLAFWLLRPFLPDGTVGENWFHGLIWLNAFLISGALTHGALRAVRRTPADAAIRRRIGLPALETED